MTTRAVNSIFRSNLASVRAEYPGIHDDRARLIAIGRTERAMGKGMTAAPERDYAKEWQDLKEKMDSLDREMKRRAFEIRVA